MTAVAERDDVVVVQPPRRGRWGLIAGVIVLALIAGVVWGLTRGPGVWLRGAPIEHGSSLMQPRCTPDVPSREVEDTFDGGGTVLGYVEGARCEFVISLRNKSAAPVTVIRIKRTARHLITPLHLVSATRDARSASVNGQCFGCDDLQPFSPMRIAPGDEWEVAVQTEMRRCTPTTDLKESAMKVWSAVEVTVEAGGLQRTVPVKLSQPWAVAYGSCR